MRINIHEIIANKEPRLEYKEQENPWITYSPKFEIMQVLGDFNSTINDIICVDNIYNPNQSPLQSLKDSNSCINTIVSSLSRIRDIIGANIDKVSGYLKQVSSTAHSSFANYSFFQKQQMLKQALYSVPAEELEIRIPNINISETLIKSPVMDLCYDEFFDMYINTIRKAKYIDYPEGIEEVLSRFDQMLDRCLMPISIMKDRVNDWRDHSIDALYNDISAISNKFFGDLEYRTREISDELFGKAYDNIDKISELNTSLMETRSKCFTAYNVMIHCLNRVAEETNKQFYPNSRFDASVDTKKIYMIVCYGMSVMKYIVNIYGYFIASKLHAVFSIIGASNRILLKSYDIIRNSSEVSVPEESEEVEEMTIRESFMSKWSSNHRERKIKNNSSYSDDSYITELNELENNFLIELSMVLNEVDRLSYNTEYRVLLEADGENTQEAPAANASTDTQPPAANAPATNAAAKTDPSKTKGLISNLSDKIMNLFKQMYDKARKNILQIQILGFNDPKFWGTNKDQLQTAPFTKGDITRTNWYNYDLDSLTKQLNFPPFDQKYLGIKSDEEFQNQLLNLIKAIPTNVSNPPDGTKLSFTNKASIMYRGSIKPETAVITDQNFNPTKAAGLVDDLCTKQKNANILKMIDNSQAELDKSKRTVDNTTDELAKQIPDATPGQAQPPATQEQTVINKQTNSLMLADFKFNLAKHFGILHEDDKAPVKSAEDTTKDQNAQSKEDPQKANQQSAADQHMAKNDAVDSKKLIPYIKRYFGNCTSLLSVQLTCVIGAYKQYMRLYRDTVAKKSNQSQQAQNQPQNTPPSNQQQK